MAHRPTLSASLILMRATSPSSRTAFVRGQVLQMLATVSRHDETDNVDGMVESYRAFDAATTSSAAFDYEVLLLQRSSNLRFAPGFWTFPGGAVDPGDYDGGQCDDDASAGGDAVEEGALRACALREGEEETGLPLSSYPSSIAGDLAPLCCFVTPERERRRFETHFFLAKASDDDDAAAPSAKRQAIRVNAEEVQDHAWLSPTAALAEMAAGRLPLMPPQFYILSLLSAHATWVGAMEATRAGNPPRSPPMLPQPVPGSADEDDLPAPLKLVLPGDAAYVSSEPGNDTADPQQRHRVICGTTDIFSGPYTPFALDIQDSGFPTAPARLRTNYMYLT
eukprot:g5292.t1